MLNNILKYKTLIKNIFLKTLPLLVWLNISYSVNNLNTQLKKQIIEMEQQSQLILTLQEEVFDLKNAVIHEEKEVQDILNQLSTVNLKNSEVTTQLQNAELLIAQNDITQFYIKTAGVVCVVGLGIIFITGIKSYFNFSFLIPTSFKHVIQDYTPFFQTKEFYALHDNANNFNWVVNVLNKKYVEILIKTKGSFGLCACI
jgi:hypothetical protein